MYNTIRSFAYSKLTFLHQEELENLLGNLQTTLGMNSHQIYPSEALPGHKNDKYMSFEMNVFIMYHVHSSPKYRNEG